MTELRKINKQEFYKS